MSCKAVLIMRKERGQNSYYKGLIGGLIVEITSDINEAKIFDTPDHGALEKSKHERLLDGFEARTIEGVTNDQ